jgi:hypothetical protein
MCFFLTVAVPAKNVDRIDEVFGPALACRPSNNPTVARAMPRGYAARTATVGGCSCDLYARPGAASPADSADHLRRKYEKRGWSAAKIARAIEQAAKHGATTNRPANGLRSDIIDRLRQLCQAAGGVSLLIHWYHGDVDTEPITPAVTRGCGVDDLAVLARELCEDQVLVIAA